ncbi:MAG: MMPL family transporter [Nevskia sp.]|nr:MMPL family transporter [Nevskia sp.]
MFFWIPRLARHPRLLLALVLAVGAGAAALCIDPATQRPRFKVDPSAEALLPAHDAERAVLEKVRLTFGEDDPVIVSVRFEPNVFTAGNLDRIDRLTERLRQLPGVRAVFSLATAPNLMASGDEVTITSFTEQARADPAQVARFPAQLAANPLYRGTLVSPDGHTAAFALSFGDNEPGRYAKLGVSDRIRAAAAEIAPGSEVHITGTLPVRAATASALSRTMAFTVPTVFILVALLLLVTYRSVRAMLAALLSVALALTLTVATAVLLGIEFNLVTAIVPPLVITIGLSYTIHLLSAYFLSRQMLPDAGPHERAEWVMYRIVTGLSLSGATTVVGFLSLLLNPLPAIRSFALLASIGTVYVGVITLTFMPPLLNALGCSREAPPFGQRLFARWGVLLANFDTRWRSQIIAVAMVLIPLDLYFASHIRSGTEFIQSFGEHSQVRQDFEAINRTFNGANLVSIYVDTHVNDALTDPVQIRPLEELEEWLRQQPEVGAVVSYIDNLKLLNQALNQDDPAHFAVPDSAAAVKQLLVFGGGDAIQRVVDPRFRSALISVRINVDGSIAIGDFLKRLDDRLALLPPPLQAQVTGSTAIATHAVAAIASGHLASIVIATFAIWALLSVMFTSMRAGLIATLPNIVPVSVYFGTLGLLHITLNPTTSLIACIVLGIAVNDTVHFLARFNADAREQGGEAGAIRSAMSSVLRPITLATAALCLGFLAFTGSELRNQVQFGALAAWTLFCAWIADMLLTPALGSRLRIVTLWDLLRLDLGRSPQHTIPLLSGLSLRQARLFALMSRLEQVPGGVRIIQEGDLARDVFVVIDGSVEVVLDRHGERKVLSKLGRGAVMGEAGYFGQRRTASVDALSPVRLLRFDSQDLERLRVRYPSIAATIFRNLNRIQAERIARMTAMVQ